MESSKRTSINLSYPKETKGISANYIIAKY